MGRHFHSPIPDIDDIGGFSGPSTADFRVACDRYEFVATQIDDQRTESDQDGSWDRAGVQDKKICRYGADHGEAHPQRAEDS